MTLFEVLGVFKIDKTTGLASLREVDSAGERTAGNMSRNFDRMGAAVAKTIKLAALAAAGAITAFGVSALKDFSQFEKGMQEVFTLLPGLSQTAKAQMMDDVQALSKEIGKLPEEIVPSLYQAISAGVPKENVFEFMRVAGEASIGGVTDLETAVDGLTSVVNAYGAESMSAQRAADVMFTAVRLGKTDFNELSQYLFQVIPTAAAVGVSFEDVAGALAQITAQGTPTRVASTQLRQMFVELSKDGTKVSDVFKEIAGVSFKEFIAQGNNVQDALLLLEKYAQGTGIGINDLFGSVEAGSAALQLTGTSTEAFTQKLNEMASSAGAATAAYEEMDQGMSRGFERLKTTFANMKLEVGEKLAPVFEKLAATLEQKMPEIERVVVGVFTAIANGIGWLLDHGDLVIGVIKGIAVAFGILEAINIAKWLTGAVSGLAAMASGAPAAGSAMTGLAALFTPAGIVTAAFVGVGLIIANVVKRLAEAREAARLMAEAYTNAAQSVFDASKGLNDSITRLADGVGLLGDKINETDFDSLITDLGTLRDKMLDVPADEMKQVWSAGVDKIFDALREKYPKIADLLDEYRNGFIQQGEQLADAVIEGIRNTQAEFKSAVSAVIDSGFNAVQQQEPSFASAGAQIGGALTDGISFGIEQGANDVGSAIGDLGSFTDLTLRSTFGVQSPAKMTIPIGSALTEGLSSGIKEGTPSVVQEVRSLGSAVNSVLQSILDDISYTVRWQFSSMIKDVISGRKTLGDAMKDMLSSIADSIINSGIDSAVDWAIGQLSRLVSGGAAAASAASSAATAASTAGSAATGAATAGASGAALGALALAAIPVAIGTSSAVAEGVSSVNKWITEKLLGQKYGAGTWKAGLGGIAVRDTLIRAGGDTGVPEGVIPLTVNNLAAIGEGITSAMGGVASQQATTFTVQINNPVVRNDSDIREIVTGVQGAFKRWERGQGRLAPVGA